MASPFLRLEARSKWSRADAMLSLSLATNVQPSRALFKYSHQNPLRLGPAEFAPQTVSKSSHGLILQFEPEMAGPPGKRNSQRHLGRRCRSSPANRSNTPA
jgi:hypothetical protein